MVEVCDSGSACTLPSVYRELSAPATPISNLVCSLRCHADMQNLPLLHGMHMDTYTAAYGAYGAYGIQGRW